MREGHGVGTSGDPLERRIRALGADRASASWQQRRVDAYLDAMMRYYDLSPSEVRAEAALEMPVAEARCALCPEVARCRRFLCGAARDDRPRAFCPNAGLFGKRLFAKLSRQVGLDAAAV